MFQKLCQECLLSCTGSWFYNFPFFFRVSLAEWLSLLGKNHWSFRKDPGICVILTRHHSSINKTRHRSQWAEQALGLQFKTKFSTNQIYWFTFMLGNLQCKHEWSFRHKNSFSQSSWNSFQRFLEQWIIHLSTHSISKHLLITPTWLSSVQQNVSAGGVDNFYTVPSKRNEKLPLSLLSPSNLLENLVANHFGRCIWR